MWSRALFSKTEKTRAIMGSALFEKNDLLIDVLIANNNFLREHIEHKRLATCKFKKNRNHCERICGGIGSDNLLTSMCLNIIHSFQTLSQIQLLNERRTLLTIIYSWKMIFWDFSIPLSSGFTKGTQILIIIINIFGHSIPMSILWGERSGMRRKCH